MSTPRAPTPRKPAALRRPSPKRKRKETSPVAARPATRPARFASAALASIAENITAIGVLAVLMTTGIIMVVVLWFNIGASIVASKHTSADMVVGRLNKQFPTLKVTALQRLKTDPALFTAPLPDGQRIYTTAAANIVILGGSPITKDQRQPMIWMQDASGQLEPQNLNQAYSIAVAAMNGTTVKQPTTTASPAAPPDASVQGSQPTQAAAPTPSSSSAPTITPPPSGTPRDQGVRLMQGVPIAGTIRGPLGTSTGTLPFGVRLFNAIPRAGMLVEQYGAGRRQAIVFVDPACPFCQHLEQTLAQLGPKADLTLTIIPYPLTLVSKVSGSWELGGTHPQALGMAEDLFCTPNPSHSWHKWMLASATTSWSDWVAKHPSSSTWSAADPLRPGCRAAIAINIGLAAGTRLGIDETPTMLMSNGMVWHGAGSQNTTPAKIMQALAYVESHPDAGKPTGRAP